jgi:ribosomal subunit interface protein
MLKGIPMKINLSGHHVEITASIKEDIEEKFSKIANHFPTLIALDIIISKEHHQHQVEVTTNYEGGRISVKGIDDVMYPAIASSLKKLDAALKHRKGQLKANLHDKPQSTAPEIAHEKVQEMNLS